jgi:hypothetical protein
VDFESHHAGTAADLTDSQSEDAFVLFDLTEEASDEGDDSPDEVSEYTEGLSGLTLDSEIQWCSACKFCPPFQSSLEIKRFSGAWTVRGFRIILNAAGDRSLLRNFDLCADFAKRPIVMMSSTAGTDAHIKFLVGEGATLLIHSLVCGHLLPGDHKL